MMKLNAKKKQKEQQIYFKFTAILRKSNKKSKNQWMITQIKKTENFR